MARDVAWKPRIHEVWGMQKVDALTSRRRGVERASGGGRVVGR